LKTLKKSFGFLNFIFWQNFTIKEKGYLEPMFLKRVRERERRGFKTTKGRPDR
jgi:hypothetical protein